MTEDELMGLVILSVYGIILIIIAIYYAYTHFCYVRAFGGSKGLAVLSLFFPGITTLILAFGKLYHEKNYHVVPHIIN